MGVLMCDRAECTRIMSDYYSHEYGYLCWECYCELSNMLIIDESEIVEFMETPPKPKPAENEHQRFLDIRKIFIPR